jgi:hypothetical protein
VGDRSCLHGFDAKAKVRTHCLAVDPPQDAERTFDRWGDAQVFGLAICECAQGLSAVFCLLTMLENQD